MLPDKWTGNTIVNEIAVQIATIPNKCFSNHKYTATSWPYSFAINSYGVRLIKFDHIVLKNELHCFPRFDSLDLKIFKCLVQQNKQSPQNEIMILIIKTVATPAWVVGDTSVVLFEICNASFIWGCTSSNLQVLKWLSSGTSFDEFFFKYSFGIYAFTWLEDGKNFVIQSNLSKINIIKVNPCNTFRT